MSQKLSEAAIKEAAQTLLSRRINNQQLGVLDESIAPTTIEESLAIQAKLVELSGDTIGGWKCLLPPNDETVVVAPILNNTVQSYQSGVCSLLADHEQARVEPEICFVFAHDLPAKEQGYSEQEIEQAIASCHMALELMKARFAAGAEISYQQKLADCLVNQGLLIGPEIDKTVAFSAAEINIEISTSNNTQTLAGKHPNGAPQKPFFWLINYLSKQGVDFKKGQAVITGSYAGIVNLAFDTDYRISYQNLGEYTIRFKDCN